MTYLEKQLRIKNMLRIFLDSIRDYENENNSKICNDDRDSLEFVEIFINSDDGFEYRKLMEEKE